MFSSADLPIAPAISKTNSYRWAWLPSIPEWVQGRRRLTLRSDGVRKCIVGFLPDRQSAQKTALPSPSVNP